MTSPNLADWIGRQETRIDRVTPAPLGRLAALLDHETPPWPRKVLPPLGHWIFHLPDTRQSELGADGHPSKGDFLPPISQPRRMWAGSRVQFLGPVPVGSLIDRRTTIAGIVAKPTQAGESVFVTLRHEIIVRDTLVIIEEQDLVYLEPPSVSAVPSAAKPVAVPDAQFSRPMTAGAGLLFRFSALTFNAHRIHYDRDYAVAVEKYPGLVVQGPLLATLLMDLFLRHGGQRRVRSFEFRARSPTFDGVPFDLCMSTAADVTDLWVVGAGGRISMTARIEAD